MIPTQSILALAPWLATVASFSQPPTLSPRSTSTSCERSGNAHAPILRASVNDDVSGFHYDQEPRGTSYLSEISKKDLWERRQMRRPQLRRMREMRRANTPNSRGAFTQQQQQFAPQYQQLQYPPKDAEIEEGGEFGAFKETVSNSLKSMTDLLKEMQESQTAQSTDVAALTAKVADMSQRLRQTEAKSRVVTESTAAADVEDKNFGTSLDGAFHQKIKDVVDQFSIVDRDGGNSGDTEWQVGGTYYGTKITQLERKINKIDEALKATEEKLDSQMQFVERLAGGGPDDMDEPGFDGMPFQQQPPPEPFLEDRPPPPPFEDFEEGPNPFMDDGRGFFQERNYNDPNNPPPPPPPMSSAQKEQETKSVNTRSGSHHYTEGNRSFISAFSKADNERRKEFRPFDRDARQGGMGSAEPLPRGATNYANRRYAVPPPPPPEPMMGPGYMNGGGHMMEEPYMMYGEGPMMEEEPYMYGGGPMMDDMYEF